MRLIIFFSVVVSLFVVSLAHAGPPVSSRDGAVKWIADIDGQQFFVDVNADDKFVAADGDAKFRIQSGTSVGEMVLGDFNGNGQSQLGIMTETKTFVDDGDFSWKPAQGNDLSGFFAPNVGLISAAVGDWNLDNADDWVKVGTGQKLFVDKNGNKTWDGAGGGDAQFRIEGGLRTGIIFSIDLGTGSTLGLFTNTKVFIDLDRSFDWKPGQGGEFIGFFAPGTGPVVAVLIGDFNGDGIDDLGKINDQNQIFLDMNGDRKWVAADGDAKFKINGGSLTGPALVGVLNATGDVVAAQFNVKKIFIDTNANQKWDPASGDIASFFATDQGDIQDAGAGKWQTP